MAITIYKDEHGQFEIELDLSPDTPELMIADDFSRERVFLELTPAVLAALVPALNSLVSGRVGFNAPLKVS